MSEAILNEIFDEITKMNSLGNAKSIPHSDEFVTLLSASMGVTDQLVAKMIKILVNSHKIFAIEIVSEDPFRSIPRVEGYIVTDIDLMRNMKSFYQKELVYMYNTQYNKNLMVHKVIREIFPIIRSLNNTPLGKIANKAIMLEEVEKLTETNFAEYTEDWKEKQLAIEMEEANVKRTKPIAKDDEGAVKGDVRESGDTDVTSVKNESEFHLNRAVDAKRYKNFISNDRSKGYPLHRILNIYGIEFFLQTNLRKYQFSYLRQIIEDRQINKRSDLMLLKDMLRAVKINMRKDSKLAQYKDDIYSLDRAISHYIYFVDRDMKR